MPDHHHAVEGVLASVSRFVKLNQIDERRYKIGPLTTFHREDLETCKQLNWIGIIFVIMMICILKKFVDYLYNY